MTHTNMEICSRRDSRVEEAIDRHGCLTTEQVYLMLFRRPKCGMRIAQRRLEKLTRQDRVKRKRPGFAMPYHYYVRELGQLEHRAGVNWVRLWLEKGLKSWVRLTVFEYEPKYEGIRPDALAQFSNTATGQSQFLFIELDRSGEFDKGQKYTEFYRQGHYLNSWWSRKADRFPAILVVCATEARLRQARANIEAHNPAGLEFDLHLLDHIREDVRR